MDYWKNKNQYRLFLEETIFFPSMKRLTNEELIEKRRLTLLARTHAARHQLDSLSLLDSTYETSRQTLRQWRLEMLDQLNKIHQKSLEDLNNTSEEFNRFRSNLLQLFNEQQFTEQSIKHIQSNLNLLRQSEFSFDFHRASQFEDNLQLLKLSHPPDENLPWKRKSNIQCRILIAHDRHLPEILFSDELITKIDCQTADCIVICSLDLLNELFDNEHEIRLLIDQTYLPSVGIQAQRLRMEYELILLQPAQECCPQSTERVIRIIAIDQKKLIACLEDIYHICQQQGLIILCEENSIRRFVLVTPMGYIPYNPSNYNRLKTHLYYGYSEIPNALPVENNCQQHFDRVLMPVSIQQTLPINDIQTGILLGHQGERLQQLQRETGALIHIGDSIEENHERRKRLVTIQGGQQQVNNAFQVIRRILMISDADDDGKHFSSQTM